MLPSLLFLCFALRNNPDPTEHWYSALLALAATTAIIDRRDKNRRIIAGTLLGLAALFSQNNGLGALAGIACFVGWECVKQSGSWRRAIRSDAYLLAPAAAVMMAWLGYLVQSAGIRSFICCTVAFPLTYWSAYPANNFLRTDFVQVAAAWLIAFVCVALLALLS